MEVCMREIPKAQELYRHFKGNLYQIISIASHSETMEQMVVYQALYGDYKVYVRPLDMFMSKVDTDKYPDATQTYRFERFTFEKRVSEVAGGVVKTEPVQKELKQEPVIDVTAEGEEAYDIHPKVLEFFDADTYEEKLGILSSMQDILTDHMINAMAVSEDLEVKKGTIAERYEDLKNCLLTKERFECNRLR